MYRPRYFGQLMALIDQANQMKHLAAQTYLAKTKNKGEIKLEKQRIASDAEIQKLDIEFKQKELTSKQAVALRQDALIKEVALYVGLGLGILVILITGGVMFLGKDPK